MPESRYWNPVLETMEPERLRELQLKKFKNALTRAWNKSPFYREIYSRAGLKPDDVNTWEDVAAVPKVEKGMLRAAQEADPFPYGKLLAVDPEEVVEYRQTSGTTGKPVYQADTWDDWEWWSECWSYIIWSQGYRPGDRVFFPFGYNIFVAFWAGHYAAEKLGCEVVPGGVLDTAARVLKVQELRCTAMMGTPTYMLNMADTAREKLGIDPAALTVGKITCAGEPGALIPATKKRMQEAWGAKVFDHAGATEIGAWGYECFEQPGGLHVNEGLFLVEIEDILSGEIITEPGKPGKMVITAFDRRAMPCVRFDSKDIIEWAAEPCACGRTYRVAKGGVRGRVDDITKVKGVLLAPTAIEEVVRGFSELGDEYEVVVERQGDSERITLKVELKDGVAEDRIIPALKDQLRLKTNLGYIIETHPLGALPRYTVKARRFKDMRKG